MEEVQGDDLREERRSGSVVKYGRRGAEVEEGIGVDGESWMKRKGRGRK